MRVAVIVSVFPMMSETFILNQIAALIDQGHEVDIYAHVAQDGQVHGVVRDYHLLDMTHYLPRLPESRWQQAVGAIRRFRDSDAIGRRRVLSSVNVFAHGFLRLSSRTYWSSFFNPPRDYDVIHCHFGPNGVNGVLWRKLGYITGKVVTTFHGYDVNRYAEYYRYSGYAQLFRDGDCFTVNSDYTLRNLLALGAERDKVVKLPMGTDLRLFPFAERRMPKQGPVRILSVGRLVEKKGIEYGIRALAGMKPRGSRVQYDIVGDGDLRQSLEALLDKLELRDRVRLLGWRTQEELRAIYADSHLMVCPSVTCVDGDQEAQGVVLQEAQACGMPVVATRIGGIPESILEGESGLLVPEKNPEALAASIDHLLDHPDMWPSMGRAGRAHVKARFDSMTIGSRLMEIYRSMLGHGPAQPRSPQTKASGQAVDRL